jgi:transposase
MRGPHAVPHENTIFRQVVSHLPFNELDTLIATHRADKGVRTLDTKTLVLVLLFAQLSGANSLRDIEDLLQSQPARRYHSGLREVRRSTLADAAALRPVEVFTGLLGALIARFDRKLRQEIRDCIRLIDSTSMSLNSLSGDWAQFSAGVCGVKAHIVYDPTADRPVYLAITPSRVNDITAAHDMPITPGATYVFDLGYYDYAWWAALDDACCRIVSRLKSNTPLRLIEERPVPVDEPHILSDRIGFLPERQAKSRRNPMQVAVREVRVRSESGKVLRIVSNDLDAPAAEIAALYKQRWAIELFFRWVKQTLKIKHFYGTSENAVRMQIAVALIAFLLLRLVHLGQQAATSMTTFARLVRANVLHRMPIAKLLDPATAPAPPPAQNNRQLALLLA